MDQRAPLDRNIENTIKEYLRLVEQSGVHVEKGIVFGSYAKGKAGGWSDIDLCVVSREFGKDVISEGARLKALTWDIDPRIEVIPYSPKDLAAEEDPLAHEIRKYGKEIPVG